MKEPNFQTDLAHSPEQLISQSDIAINPETGLAVVVIKPDAFADRDSIVHRIEDSGLHVVESKTRQLSENFVLGAMYPNMPDGIQEQTMKHWNSGPAEILLVRGGPNMLEQVVSLTGEKTNPNECGEETLRYLFGEHFGRDADGKLYYRNAVHRAKDETEQEADLQKFRHII